MGLSIEARVGAFVLAALVLLAGLALALGGADLSSSGFKLFADFAYAGNLQSGAPVRVSGVRVGHVRRVVLLDPSADPPAAIAERRLGQAASPLVRAELDLDEHVAPMLTRGTQIAVGFQGLVGEPYLELLPGRRDEPPIAATTAMRGIDAPELHRIALDLGAVTEAVGRIAYRATPSRGGEQGEGPAATIAGGYGELGRAFDDLTAAAADLRVILAEARAAVGEGRLSGLVADLRATSDGLARDLPALLGETQAAVERIGALAAAADRAVDGDELAVMVADARRAAHNLAELSERGRILVARVERGEGTLGGLVRDPQVYQDLKDVLRDLKRHPWKLLWRE